MNLTEEEVASCRKAFLSFDKDRSGTVDIDELKILLLEMRLQQTDADLAEMVGRVDENNTGEVTFSGFIKLVEELKKKATQIDKQNDMKCAWVACGGDESTGGHIDKEALIGLLTGDFALDAGVEDLLRGLRTNTDGRVQFDELNELLATPRR
jgi:Ca2+-binding EF-hand superfamily protein